ncbi:hypothetical protein HanLR1_Chr01g0019381 [Helianthus annuus]|nr:hypothetical protein HanHA89_Chr09g0320821 [Helianthus annuus]KAJ0783350.1 hypothetical protein HanLR1_Chr01g0019381 [Helianthus annuus]
MISVQIIEYRGVISRIFKCFGNGVDGYCDRVSSGLVHQLFTNLKLSWMKIIQE